MQRHVLKPSQRLAQAILQSKVDLDHVQVSDAIGQALGQDARAAADLEHHVVGLERGEALDHPEDVAVDEEVLAQLAPPRDPRPTHPHHANAAAALDSMARSSSA